jgi:hypothetical protein
MIGFICKGKDLSETLAASIQKVIVAQLDRHVEANNLRNGFVRYTTEGASK